MNELLSMVTKRNVGQIVVRRTHYPFRRGLAPTWMERLEPRLLFAFTATPIDGGVRLDSGGGDSSTAIAVQADGKILIGAYDGSKSFESGAHPAFVMRLNPDHTIDTTFGDDGYAAVSFKRDVNLESLVVQTDGSILGSGAYYDNSVNRFDYGVFKLNADGQVDSSFGNDGLAMIDVSGEHDNNWGTKLSVDSQGRILVLGMVDTPQPASDVDGAEFSTMQFVPELIRLTSDGNLDTSFGDGGHIVIGMSGAPAGSVTTSAVYAQPDGSILLSGSTQTWVPAGQTQVQADHRGAFILKLNDDGSDDASFGDGGFAYLGGDLNSAGVPSYDSISGLGVQSDGKIVVAEEAPADFETADTGANHAVGGGYRLLRLNADGSTDSSFTPYEVQQQFVPVPTDMTYIMSTISLAGSANTVHINDDGIISALFSTQYTPGPSNPGPMTIGVFSSTGELESSNDISVDVGKEFTTIDAAQFTSPDTMEMIGSAIDVAPPAAPTDSSEASESAYSEAVDAWSNNYDIFGLAVGTPQAGDQAEAGPSTNTSLTVNESSIFSAQPVQQQDNDNVLAGAAKDTLTGDVSDSLDLVLTP